MYSLKTPSIADRNRVQSEVVKFLDEHKVAMVHRREVTALILGSIVAGSLSLPADNKNVSEFYRTSHANPVNTWLGRLAEFFTFDQKLAAIVAFDLYSVRIQNAYPETPFVIKTCPDNKVNGVVRDIVAIYPGILGELPWSVYSLFVNAG